MVLVVVITFVSIDHLFLTKQNFIFDTSFFFLMSELLTELCDLIVTYEKQQQRNHSLVESLVGQLSEQENGRINELQKKVSGLSKRLDDTSKKYSQIKDQYKTFNDTLVQRYNEVNSQFWSHRHPYGY